MSARNHYVYELLCEDGPYIGLVAGRIGLPSTNMLVVRY